MDRHVAVTLELLQVPFNQQAELFPGVIRLGDLFPEAIEYLLGLVSEKIHHDVFFIFKIKIDGPIRHTGLPGDLADGCLVKALLGKHFYGGIQNLVILAVCFGFLIDNCLQ